MGDGILYLGHMTTAWSHDPHAHKTEPITLASCIIDRCQCQHLARTQL